MIAQRATSIHDLQLYLDFQKAFDKVTHQRLLLKLKSHGAGISIVERGS